MIGSGTGELEPVPLAPGHVPPRDDPLRRSSSSPPLPIFLGMNTFAEEIIARSARKDSVEVVEVASRELYADLFHLYERDKHRGAEWLILHRSELIIGKLPDGTTWRVEILQINDDGEPFNCGMDWC